MPVSDHGLEVLKKSGEEVTPGDKSDYYIKVANKDGSLISSGGGGSGTEYTEDAAAAANPVGTQVVARRRDSLVGETSTDGDVVALNSTDKGELYVKHVDSLPVTGTFFQATQPVSAASLPLPSGAATSALQTTGNTSLSTLAGAVAGTEVQVDVVAALPTGDNNVGRVKLTDGTTVADVSALTNSNALHVLITDALGNQVTSFGGSITEYTEDVGGVPDPVGQVPLMIRKDTPGAIVSTDGDLIAPRSTNYGAQYVQVVTSAGAFVDSFAETKPNTGASSNVSGSATTVTLLASNASRKGATIFNDSTAILYVKLGATASTTSFTSKMDAGDYYEVPFGYTGVIDGIWASATGSARMTEIT